MPQFAKPGYPVRIIAALGLIVSLAGCSKPGEAPAAGASPESGGTGGDKMGLTISGAEGRLLLGDETCLEFELPTLGGAGEPAVEVATAAPGWRRVRLTWAIPAEIRRDDLAVRFVWRHEPDTWWTPHLAPEPGNVIAQHIFRSPAIVSQRGPLTVVIVPDLDLVGASEANPWYLDLDAPARTAWLGMSRTEIPVHVLYRKAPGMTIAPGRLELGFYVTAYLDGGAVRNPWGRVSRFLWERWARPLFAAGEPVGAPLDRYIEHTYRWAFDSWGKFVWQEFDLEGKRVGAPQFIVNISQSPNYPGEWYQREFLSVWNQAWFSSLRSASGLFRYARRTGGDDLMKRARLTKELALAAPMKDGLFPSVIRTDNVEIESGGKKLRRPKGWETAYWTNSNRSPADYGIPSTWYHVLDMSWTAFQMLRWHRDLEPDPKLLDFARRYGDKLLTLQDAAGFFPGWLDPATGAPGPVMNQTPETSQSVTFLLALAEATGNAAFRKSALAAMDVVLRDVVPQGRWEDFETYWSCCAWGRKTHLGRKIERSAMHKQNTFSMFWTAEALLASYRATRERRYLDAGLRCLDELSMAQQVWQPPFIHVPALGGFGVMNSDGEWNDSRETLFAELFLDFYRETGDPVLFERGIAALRSGFIMMYCPENPKVKAMWEKVYPWFGPADYGFTMENYGHGGRTSAEGEGMGSFTIYDWGNGAAAEAAARITDHYGQVYVDRPRGRGFGLDMVEVRPLPDGWEITDRSGSPRELRIVYEDGSSAKRSIDGRLILGRE